MYKQLMFPICLTVVLGLTARASEPFGHWPFDGHVNDVADSANGTFFGGSPDYVNGRIEQAIRFDGVDDYVEVMVENLDAYTITAWVMPDRVEPASIVVRTSPSGTTTHWSHQMRIAASGQFEHYVWDGAAQTALGTTQVEAGNWYFVAVSATNNGPVRVYVNAQEEGTAGSVATMWADGDRYDIGSNSGGAFGWFPGIIDDVRIYDQELTEAELDAMMTEAPFPFAFGPKPANGTMLGQTSVGLEWRAGDFAVSHDVYIGENFDDVNDGLVEAIPTTETSITLVAPDGPYPGGLVPGQTYYWRVDEVDEAHPDSPWKGDVWSFWVQPAGAWAPTPADGGKYVLTDQVLTWQIGMGTLFHTVYFGENFDEVNSAVTGGWMIADALYDPGTLETGMTYYWRVDEFTMTGTVTGETWSFTTLPEIPLAEDPNLTLWWTLGEGMGGTAVDWSGHGNHGSLRGDPQWIDGVLTFDGRNDYVSVVLDVSETEYAAAFWFKTTSADGGLMTVVQDDLGGGGNDRHVYLTGGNIKTRLWDTEEIESAGLNLADGQWHHVVYTYGASIAGQKLYVDGVLQASGIKDASDFDWQERVNIGFSNDSAPPYFEGVLQDVRIYDRTLSAEEVQQLMRGDPLLAWNPQPSRGATVDVRDATALTWSAGDTAVSHDVYLGTDRDAVAAAGPDAAEYRGNQPGTSFPLAGLVEFGGGAYYWRIDEVEADGTVHPGNVWTFTIPAYLIVDDFESYTNEVGSRLFEAWVDGVGYTLPEPGHRGNGSGAVVGHDIWSVASPHFGRTIVETDDVHGGGKAMPLYYDNSFAPSYSEAERTWATTQNWTAEGVEDLVLFVRGAADNAAAPLYVVVQDTAGNLAVLTHSDATVVTTTDWTEWKIPLSSVSDAGVTLTAVKKMCIGTGNRAASAPGGAGMILIDDVRLTRP